MTLTDGVNPRAGQPAQPGDLVDVATLLARYASDHPDPAVAGQRVSFGTSGHRGSSLSCSFNEDHILATTQAICDWRAQHGITGPLFLGADTHALSQPATRSALEVLAANDVAVLVDARGVPTPTPAVSHAIIRHNRAHPGGAAADGIVVTPSHNPPTDGGFKYNPPHGGPADATVTKAIEQRANELLAAHLAGVRRSADPRPGTYDFVAGYVEDLPAVIDIDAIRASGLRIGVDPLGGASVDYWSAIADTFTLDLTVVDATLDPTWFFMTLDWDGKIRMDPSSAHAMAKVIARRGEFDLMIGNDADADRHGIVTPDAGLLNPNAFLTVAIDYLVRHRPGWSGDLAIGKTAVSSALIDRVVAELGRRLIEVPVGFKWFVPGLADGSLAFGGEESAGAAFLRQDGTTWTTDKDGILLGLLAAEITAVAGRSPSQVYDGICQRLGRPVFARVDAPASAAQRAALAAVTPDCVAVTALAGEPVASIVTTAPGNGEPIGGLKVVAEGGWFAARPSGTEDLYKIYAESFGGDDHLRRVQRDAAQVVERVFATA